MQHTKQLTLLAVVGASGRVMQAPGFESSFFVTHVIVNTRLLGIVFSNKQSVQIVLQKLIVIFEAGIAFNTSLGIDLDHIAGCHGT